MIEHDPGRALTAMAHAVNAGHEPRTLAEALVRHLRDGFLSLMAPELVQLSAHQVDELAAQAQRLGPAALVRAIERLGEILVELRHAPDPRVLVEVALVQLTTAPPAAGDDIGALAARVDQARAGRRRAVRRPPPRRVDPATGRTALGGRARRADATAAAAPGTGPAPEPAAPASVPAAGAARRAATSAPSGTRSAVAEGPRAGRCSRRSTSSAPAAGTVDAGRAQRHPPRQVRAAPPGRRAGLEGGDRPRRHRRRRARRCGERCPDAGGRCAGRPPDRSRPPPMPTPTSTSTTSSTPRPAPSPTTLDRLAQAFPGAELIEGSD